MSSSMGNSVWTVFVRMFDSVSIKDSSTAKPLRLAMMFFAVICLTSAIATPAHADEVPPEEVMTRFLNAFVAYDYDACRSLLAPDATISIVRRDGEDSYKHSFQSAAEWLDKVGFSGVKNLDSFSAQIHDVSILVHIHGANVVLKFSAEGRAADYRFVSSGFDTGNLIKTSEGWRILHYSSFEEFRSNESSD